MKKTIYVFLTIFGLSLMVSCHSNQQQNDINLNNGEKWEVSAEMKPHIERGFIILDEFISKKDNDYLKLAENLKAQNNSLIKSCNMKGKSHDELHKWLHPHMQLIEKLSMADNTDGANEVITDLINSFETYKAHFH